jgi:HEAT repeat protein
LLGRLMNLDRYDQEIVIRTLADIGAEPEQLPLQSTPLLAPLLTGPQATYTHYEAERVGKLLARVDPAEARRQVSLLIPILADQNKPIDLVALYALTGLAREADEAVPLLISLLTDRGSEAMYSAIQALADVGPDAAPAVPTLIAILDRWRAAGTLSTYGAIFKALGNIGQGAKSAVPLLLAILDDPVPAKVPKNGEIQHEQGAYIGDVISALGKIAIDSPDVRSAILGQLLSESSMRRTAAMHTMADFAEHFPEAHNEVIKILRNDADRDVRVSATWAIVAASRDSQQAVAALAEALKDSDSNVRASAARAIATLSGYRQPPLAPLTEALGDSNPQVRISAAIALTSIGPTAKSALPAVRQALLEARCGIPRFQQEDYHRRRQQPLAQELFKAIAKIEHAD